MPQPILRTDRLRLVPLADEHLGWEVRLDSDPEVLRYISGRAHSRDEVVKSHAQRMALAAGALGYWAAFGPDEEFVGLMMLPPAPGTAVAELGYRIVRRYWRLGLASEAAGALLRHAFDSAGQERVIAQTMAVNEGSRGVMRAVGMRHVRTFFPSWDEPLPFSELGEVEYEITREMWQAAR
jgi:RimJ/RimL family protein N-acetyltransferase